MGTSTGTTPASLLWSVALAALGLAGLRLTADVPAGSAGTPTGVATSGGLGLVAAVIAGHYLAATLVIQVALLAAGQVLLDDADAWVQLGMAAVATGAMHVGACAVMAWRASHDLQG